MAFSTLEPFGAFAENIGHAITASTVANVHRGKNQKAYSIEDFMPKYKKKQQSLDEMKQVAAMMTVGLGGQDLRSEKSD